ncbi:MAG: permease [Candidatus Omnitrophica bacterium]|nr:permease [Candidatus Omnitrophota bacterium]
MLVSTLIMAILAVALSLMAYFKGAHVAGIKQAANMSIQILPLLVLAFIIAGMVQVLLPYETISRWVGESSGMRGILIGTVAGAFTPGGPYVSMPIAVGLLRTGASMGTMVAYMTGWSLWAFSRLPLEVGILGWRFTIIRMISVLILPPIAGFIAQFVSKLIR